MDYSKTDRLFQQLREEPVKIPFSKMEKFILAQAVTGIAAAGTAKGLFGLKKLALTFHLNSFIIMTSIVSASLISIFVWQATHHSATTAASVNKEKQGFAFTTPDTSKKQIILPSDTPAVAPKPTHQNVSVTTTTTTTNVSSHGACTSVSVSTSTSSGTSESDNNATDSAYAYSYATTGSDNESDDDDDATSSTVVRVDDNVVTVNNGGEMPDLNLSIAPMPEIRINTCNHTDSLPAVIKAALLKDGLITDSSHFRFKINSDGMKVDGKKQDKKTWERYKDIVEQNSKNKVGKNFSFELVVDGKSTTLNVENYTD